MAIANISSDYDLELVVSNVALQHLIHLFFDTGKIPATINLLDFSLTILTENDSALNRTYSPADDYMPTGTTAGALDVNVLVFDEEPDHIYLRLSLFVIIPGLIPSPPGFPLDGYIKLPHIIDGQRLFEKLQSVIEGEADTFYLTPYAEVVSIQYGGTDFDPLDPQAGPSSIPGTSFDLDDFLPSIQTFLNTAITDALKAAKVEHDNSPDPGNEIVNFIQSQIDLLGNLRLDKIALQAFPETNRLGLYANFILLDHDRGFVGNRGNKENGIDFLGEDRHLAIASSPRFLSHLIDDILIKAILKEDIENGDLQEWEVENRLLFEHYPIRFPYSLLSDGILHLPLI